ncbi:MAG: hypothetical protein Q7J80_06210 [Anaerolineales bacterium]|nr:hypothetical protein [Anaerolineales bacterium]
MLKIFTTIKAKADAPKAEVRQSAENASHPPPAPVSPAPPAELKPQANIMEPAAKAAPGAETTKADVDWRAAMAKTMTDLMAQVRQLGATCEALGNSITTALQEFKNVEGNYKALLMEDQNSIREMIQHIRDLENRQFREEVLKPLIQDIIMHVDALVKLRNQFAGEAGSIPEAAVDCLGAMETELLASLARYGVKRMSRAIAAIDLRRQQIVRVDQVTVPKNGDLKSIERDGYEWDGQVLRSQEITAYKVG